MAFTYVPDYGASVTYKPAVTKIQFGDGYSQRTAQGINSVKRVWQLSFNNRSTADSDAMLAFFASMKGATSFDWTPPTGVVGKFICQEWSSNASAYEGWNVSATFEEVFE